MKMAAATIPDDFLAPFRRALGTSMDLRCMTPSEAYLTFGGLVERSLSVVRTCLV